MTTTCRNDECTLYEGCKHNIYKDGMRCAGNELGYHYRSQIQAIHADYEKECERKGVAPMPRNMYLE